MSRGLFTQRSITSSERFKPCRGFNGVLLTHDSWIDDWEMERILEACAEVGTLHAGYIMLRLPYELKGLFESWLTPITLRGTKVLNGIRRCAEVH